MGKTRFKSPFKLNLNDSSLGSETINFESDCNQLDRLSTAHLPLLDCLTDHGLTDLMQVCETVLCQSV